MQRSRRPIRARLRRRRCGGLARAAAAPAGWVCPAGDSRARAGPRAGPQRHARCPWTSAGAAVGEKTQEHVRRLKQNNLGRHETGEQRCKAALCNMLGGCLSAALIKEDTGAALRWVCAKETRTQAVVLGTHLSHLVPVVLLVFARPYSEHCVPLLAISPGPRPRLALHALLLAMPVSAGAPSRCARRQPQARHELLCKVCVPRRGVHQGPVREDATQALGQRLDGLRGRRVVRLWQTQARAQRKASASDYYMLPLRKAKHGAGTASFHKGLRP